MAEDIRMPRELAARLLDDYVDMHNERLSISTPELVLWIAETHPDFVVAQSSSCVELIGRAYLDNKQRQRDIATTSLFDYAKLMVPGGTAGLLARGIRVEKQCSCWKITVNDIIGPGAVINSFKDVKRFARLRLDIVGGAIFMLEGVVFSWPQSWTIQADAASLVSQVTLTAERSEFVNETPDEGTEAPVG